MSGEFYPPDGRLNGPELYYPGRKPIGKVKIDWSNPLSKGLSFFSLFDNLHAENLVDSEFIATSGATNNIGLNGKNLSIAAASNFIKCNAKASNTDSVDYTIFALFDYTATVGAYPTIAGLGGASNQLQTNLQLFSTTRAVEVTHYDTAFRTVSSGFNCNVGFNKVCLVKKGTSFIFNVNGETTTKSALTETPIYDVGYQFCSNVFDTNVILAGGIYTALYFNRALTDAEVTYLYNNPYFLLTPDRT